METKSAYQEKFAAQMKEWSAQIALLEAKAGNTGADLRLKRDEELNKLRQHQQAALDKMQELTTASGEAWDLARLTTDKLWDDIKTGIKAASSKF